MIGRRRDPAEIRTSARGSLHRRAPSGAAGPRSPWLAPGPPWCGLPLRR